MDRTVFVSADDGGPAHVRPLGARDGSRARGHDPEAPPIDSPSQPARPGASGAVRGRVLRADGLPVRRARVQLSSADRLFSPFFTLATATPARTRANERSSSTISHL